jgi:hypothetical protein
MRDTFWSAFRAKDFGTAGVGLERELAMSGRRPTPDLHRRTFIAGAASAVTAPAILPAIAQSNYPARPIRVIVPFAAGGPSETQLLSIRLAPGRSARCSQYSVPMFVVQISCMGMFVLKPAMLMEMRMRLP